MEDVSDRHQGDAGGRLTPAGARPSIAVGIEVDGRAAALVSTQHTAWMLTNLLARFDRVLSRVDIECPSVPLAPQVIPQAPVGSLLSTAIVKGAAAIKAVPVMKVRAIESTQVDLHFVVGPGSGRPDTIRVYGDAWTGAISPMTLPTGRGSPLPFGPYAAACLAAAHAFLQVRALVPPASRPLGYSLWSLSPVAPVFTDGPSELSTLQINAAAAGVGAVGSSWLNNIWATPNLEGLVVLVDNDPDGVTRSNLNRCPLFTSECLGAPKAEAAARICEGGSIEFIAHHGHIQDVRPQSPLVVSCVDTNQGRTAVQSLYPPRILSASTRDLRAELLRCDPSGGTPCLRCYNPPESSRADDDLRREFLDADPARKRDIVDSLGIAMDDAVQWAIRGACGYAGDRLLAYLRAGQDDHPADFAVGFVSVMAGTMLAAQTLKEAMGTAHPLHDVTCRAVLVFVDPSSPRNSPSRHRRDSRCTMCEPDSQAGSVWRRRYELGAYSS